MIDDKRDLGVLFEDRMYMSEQCDASQDNLQWKQESINDILQGTGES